MPLAIVNASIAGCFPFPALLSGGKALALSYWRDSGLVGTSSFHSLIEHWQSNNAVLAALWRSSSTSRIIGSIGVPISMLRLHAPASPGQVYCTIGNYRSQVIEAALDANGGPQDSDAQQRRTAAEQELDSRRRNGEPYICLKGAASVGGPYDNLPIDASTTTLDWEVEVGVVIGRTAWKVDATVSMDHVAGYCTANDITLRERVFRKNPQVLGTDWLQSKAHPGWLPLGPWLIPAWEIADSSSLRPWLRLNGEIMQQGIASDMVFNIAEQIAYLSSHVRLEPGDVICTGSPAGFGSHYGRYLRPGDIVEAGVEGLGSQRIMCVKPPPSVNTY